MKVTITALARPGHVGVRLPDNYILLTGESREIDAALLEEMEGAEEFKFVEVASVEAPAEKAEAPAPAKATAKGGKKGGE